MAFLRNLREKLRSVATERAKLPIKFGKMGLLAVTASAFVLGSLGYEDAHAQSRKKRLKLLEQLSTTLKLITEAEGDAWRELDPDNTILMDLPAGPVVIELRPDFAPINAGRIKTLVREGFYDGLYFHRVIEGFVAQGGDPKGDGSGGSNRPDIKAEFSRPLGSVGEFTVIGRDRIAAQVGFVDGLPVASQPASLSSFLANGTSDMWGIHCPGTMSMARATPPDSANSQFFFVIGDARLSLDSRYSVWGWAVHGLRYSKRISRGEPPTRPTPIVRVRLLADIPEDERPDVKVFRTSHPNFQKYLEATGKVKDGLVRDICDIKIPTKVDGEVKL